MKTFIFTTNKDKHGPYKNQEDENVLANHCDVCNKMLLHFHFSVCSNTYSKYAWVCSEECADMFILQNI